MLSVVAGSQAAEARHTSQPASPRPQQHKLKAAQLPAPVRMPGSRQTRSAAGHMRATAGYGESVHCVFPHPLFLLLPSTFPLALSFSFPPPFPPSLSFSSFPPFLSLSCLFRTEPASRHSMPYSPPGADRRHGANGCVACTESRAFQRCVAGCRHREREERRVLAAAHMPLQRAPPHLPAGWPPPPRRCRPASSTGATR